MSDLQRVVNISTQLIKIFDEEIVKKEMTDVYTRVASRIFTKPIEEVTKEDRTWVKERLYVHAYSAGAQPFKKVLEVI